MKIISGILVCLILVSGADTYATGLPGDNATLAAKAMPDAGKEIGQQSGVRALDSFVFDEFTHMTPAKFMGIMPQAIAAIRGRQLSEAENEQLREFSALFAFEQPRYNALMDEVETLSGVRWLIKNGKDYEDHFPGVCYEAADGVSQVLQRAGIPHRRLCRIRPDGGARQNYDSVVLCGVECIIDLAFENYGSENFAGIMIIPIAFCGDDRLHEYLGLYTQWRQYADVEYGKDGKIQAYTFMEPNAQTPICTGTVAEHITFTLEEMTRIEIRLTSMHNEQPVRFIVIDHAAPDMSRKPGPITVSYGANKAAMTILDVGESVRVLRERGSFRQDNSDEEQVYTTVTVQRQDGLFKPIRFPDPKLSTKRASFLERQLVDAGIRAARAQEGKTVAIGNGLPAVMIDAEAVRWNEASDMDDMSAYPDDVLKTSFLWKDMTRAWFVKDRFPDGEIYVRVLNAEKIKGRDMIYTCDITESESLLTLLFMIDIAHRSGARSVKVYFPDWARVASVSYRKSICDMLAAMNELVPVEGYGRTDQAYQRLGGDIVLPSVTHERAEATMVLALDERLTRTAENLAKRLNIPSMTVVRRGPDYERQVNKLKDERVILIHSMSNSDMTEDLLEALPHLRRIGVRSIYLALTYLSYARQDKEFPNKSGASVSGRAIAEYLYRWSDAIYAVTIHAAGEDVQGTVPVRMGKAEVINLNGFTQLVEYAFGLIREGLKLGFERKAGHPPSTADMREMLIEEFHQRPLYLVGPDQGSAIAVDHAREVLQKRLQEKFGISKTDVEVKVAFMEKMRKNSKEVTFKPQLYRFMRNSNGEIKKNAIGKPEGEPRNMDEINKSGWVFLVDDEIALGTTTKGAEYVLVKDIGFKPYRILTLWVHGKFPNGIGPIVGPRTRTPADIIDGIVSGELLRDDINYDFEGMIDRTKRHLVPFCIATTNSYYSRYSQAESTKVININDLMNVNLYRLFSHSLKQQDIVVEENDLLPSA